MNGGDDVGVGAAAADVAGHGFLDVVIGCAPGLFGHGDGGHDLAGGAVAALVAVVLDKGGLHGVEVAGLAEAFDGGDLGLLVHGGEGEAAIDAAAVEVDSAGSALAVVAALFCAGEMEGFAEGIEESGAGIDGEGVGFAVDPEGDGCGAGDCWCGGSGGGLLLRGCCGGQGSDGCGYACGAHLG